MKAMSVRHALFLLIFMLVAVPVFSRQSKKFSWGIYGGWSWGTGYTFHWHYRPYSDRSSFRYHLGGYTQLNLFPSFGLQLEANYQRGLYEWTLQHPSFLYSSGEESFDFLSLCLKGICNLPVWGRSQFYVAAGGGISSGEWGSFDGVYFNLTAGPGIRLFIGGEDSNVALNLGGAFVYLFELDELDSDDAFYIRLNVGIEF